MNMHSRHYERGTSLPETALVLGVLLMLLFGIIDFGRAMYTYAFVTNMAREGARWAMVRGNQCTVLDHCNAQSIDVQTFVRSRSVGVTDANNITATLTWAAGPSATTCPTASNTPGCAAVVTVSYPFNFMLPYMPAIAPIQMSSTSQMIVSQ